MCITAQSEKKKWFIKNPKGVHGTTRFKSSEKRVQLRSALVYCACAQRDRKVKPVSEIFDLLKKQHANEVPRNALIGMEETV